MKEKKNFALRIVHAVILSVSLILCFVALINNSGDTTVYGSSLAAVGNVLNILALIFGIIYLLLGYKKDAANFYKAFMAVLFIGEFLQMVYIAALPISVSFVEIICNLLPVVAVSILASAKDLGKAKTLTIIVVYVTCRLIRLTGQVSVMDTLGDAKIGVISSCFENLLVALTAGFMVIGKYRNKKERGTK